MLYGPMSLSASELLKFECFVLIVLKTIKNGMLHIFSFMFYVCSFFN